MIGKKYLNEHRGVEGKDEPDSYNSFMQNLQGIGFQLNKDFKLIFLYGPVEAMTGYSRQDFLSGKVEWPEVIIPEDRPVILKRRGEIKAKSEFYY